MTKPQSLKSILSRFSERAGREVSLDGLLHDWSRFASEVERGYDFTIYDYANDLSVRRMIQEILQNAPSEDLVEAEKQVAEIDERFRIATRPRGKPLTGEQVPADEWWQFRIPWRMGDELRQDLA